MSDISGGYPEGVWDAMRSQELEPLSEEDGYRWGLSHIEHVKKELLKLEERALTKRDVELLHNIVTSKLRAVEVEHELREKLGKTQE
ncbi:MAG: hypothetical protein ACREBB_09670 [Nitrosotalea sp.]